MRKKLSKLLICFSLSLSLCTSAFAVDPAAMTDIDGHWAQDAISYCLTENLFQGMSETEFGPEFSMTRGMFVTVLGRMVDVDETQYQDWYLTQLYSDVNPDFYYAPYINWATRYGIVNGMGDGTFSPDALITREQMATIVVRFASIYNYMLLSAGEVAAASFTDSDTISQYAQDAVETLRITGILNGYQNDDGSYRFGPQETATRAQCATLFYRLNQALAPYEGRDLIDPEVLEITPSVTELKVGETGYCTVSISPEETTNQTITWVSTDTSVLTIGSDGQFTALAEGTAEIHAFTWNGLTQSCTITVTADTSLAYAGETYEEKCMRIFGEVTDEYRTYYDINDTSYLVTVPVQVWDFTDSTHTEKTTKTIYLQVHKNIAATVQAIFEEIYNGDEQFPIYSAGGYYRSTYSEHTPGLAIDINPNENYECTNDGTAMTGSYWKPGEDPYSIPPDGDVVQAFRKYGFGWGADWNSKKDYMHFSYFGT